MNPKRVFYGMVGLVILFVIANFGTIFVGNLLLHNKANTLTSLKLDSRVLDEQQNSLKQAKKDIEKYQSLVKIADTVVPQDKDQAAAVREIVKIARNNGITLSAISFPASTLGTIAPKATATDSATTTPKATSPGITQVTPVEGIKGVFSLQISVQQDTSSPVTYAKLINFLTSLEQNRRTAQVTSVSVLPNPLDRSKLTFNLTLVTYIKP